MALSVTTVLARASLGVLACAFFCGCTSESTVGNDRQRIGDTALAEGVQGSWVLSTTVTESDCETEGATALANLQVQSEGELGVSLLDSDGSFSGRIEEAQIKSERTTGSGEQQTYQLGIVGPLKMVGTKTVVDAAGCRTVFDIEAIKDDGTGSIDSLIRTAMTGTYSFSALISESSGLDDSFPVGTAIDTNVLIDEGNASLLSVRLFDNPVRLDLQGPVNVGQLEAFGVDEAGLTYTWTVAFNEFEQFEAQLLISDDVAGASAVASAILLPLEDCPNVSGRWDFDFGFGSLTGDMVQTFCAAEWIGPTDTLVGIVLSDNTWAGYGFGTSGEFEFSGTFTETTFTATWDGGTISGVRQVGIGGEDGCFPVALGIWDLDVTHPVFGPLATFNAGVMTQVGCQITFDYVSETTSMVLAGVVDADGNWAPSVNGEIVSLFDEVVVTFSGAPGVQFSGITSFGPFDDVFFNGLRR